MRSVRGKVVLVTGGATGIGAALARRLHAGGAALVLTDLDAAALAATAESLGGQRVQTVVADVRDFPAMQAAVDTAVARFGGLDTVVANAGIISEIGRASCRERVASWVGAVSGVAAGN